MTSILRAALFAAACGCGMAAVQPGQPSATEIANQVQARYDRVRDFSADFTQEAISGVLRKKLVERGSVIVNLVLGGCAAYRTQLFLYLKACGREELNTMNLWAGADAPMPTA